MLRKRKKIKHLREVLREHIGDAAYWFCLGDSENYNVCHKRAVTIAKQIRILKGGKA